MITWKPALALGAVLAVGGATSADDRDTVRTAGDSTGTTMTLGGKGTTEQAATEDNELAGGYRGGHYGGYYGWGGGYGGYRGYYGGGYGGYRGYYGGGYHRGYYGGYYGNYYRPAYYYPRAYYASYYGAYPVYPSYYYGGYSAGIGFSIGIGGNAVALDASAVNLGASMAPPVPQPMTAQPMAPSAAPGDGTFRYDGGPANPVPLPKADPQPMVPPSNSLAPTDLPVSLKPKPATSPYKYKAYGEK